MTATTIVCLHDGRLAGRHDTSANDTPPEVLAIARGRLGEVVAGYKIESASAFGSRVVVIGRSVEAVARAIEAERRSEGGRRPWRLLPAR